MALPASFLPLIYRASKRPSALCLMLSPVLIYCVTSVYLLFWSPSPRHDITFMVILHYLMVYSNIFFGYGGI